MAAYPPQPQLRDLRDLVAAARQAGTEVALTDLRADLDVPPAVALTVYR